MAFKGLYILVEYNDDLRFFRGIIKPLLEGRKYDWVELWRYARKKKQKVSDHLKSISRMGADYIYVTDINDAPSERAKKLSVQSKFKRIDLSRIAVVQAEIESWYLAGLDDTSCKQLGIPVFASTDAVTKEEFNRLIPRKFRKSRIDFMAELLKYFDVETAKRKNSSFRDFVATYDC
jgi:hypothetical protein